MPTTRYFKATDGKITYFRASPSQVYQSLTPIGAGRYPSEWTFHRDGRGRFPAIEISRQEYVALTALKVARFEAAKAEWMAAHPGETPNRYAFQGTAPSDSWVRNEAIEAQEITERHNKEGGPAGLRALFKVGG